jgi:hypothetical protein
MLGDGILLLTLGERVGLRHPDGVTIDASAYSLHQVGNMPGCVRLDGGRPGGTGLLMTVWCQVGRKDDLKISGIRQQRHNGGEVKGMPLFAFLQRGCSLPKRSKPSPDSAR